MNASEMKEWVHSTLCEKASRMMDEAFRFYEAEGYQEAFFKSYQAFKVDIRECLLRDAKELAQNSDGETKQVFVLNHEKQTVKLYEYWKAQRNNCAHAKGGEITKGKVESFWDDFCEMRPEFYLRGGKELLKKRFSQSCELYETYGGEKVNSCLRRAVSLYDGALEEFFGEMYREDRQFFEVNARNHSFWEEIVNTGSVEVQNAFLDFWYDDAECSDFVKFYGQFPDLYGRIQERHIDFAQGHLAPYLESEDAPADEYYWKLLAQVLKTNVKFVNLEKIAVQYSKFQRISECRLTEEEEQTLRDSGLFGEFLEKAGKEYFCCDASAQWDYYDFSKGKEDKDAEECLRHIEWDIGIIKKLEEAYGRNEESISDRENSDSIANGKRRRRSYEKVLEEHREEILQKIKAANRELKEFPNLQKILTNE